MTGSQSGGAFAIDNVLIGSSAADAKSTYSDTYVACLKLAIELAVVHFSWNIYIIMCYMLLRVSYITQHTKSSICLL